MDQLLNLQKNTILTFKAQTISICSNLVSGRFEKTEHVFYSYWLIFWKVSLKVYECVKWHSQWTCKYLRL